MPSTQRPTPIAGMNSAREMSIMTVYPSIACMALGRAMGKLFESLPTRVLGVKLSHWLFPLPLSPGALILYFYLKVCGERYTLTNRSMQIWKSLGNRLVKQVALSDVKDIAIAQDPGQVFYCAADLQLLGHSGEVLLRLEGVPNPEVFRNTILEARDARKRTDASQATIKARQTA